MSEEFRRWYVVTWWMGGGPGFQDYNDLKDAEALFDELKANPFVSTIQLAERTQRSLAKYTAQGD